MTSRRRTSRRIRANARTVYGDPAAAARLRRDALKAAKRAFALASKWSETGKFDRAEMKAAHVAARDAERAAYDATIATYDASPEAYKPLYAANYAASVAHYIVQGRDEDARELLKDLRKMLADTDVKLRSNRRRRRTSRRC